MFGKQELDVVPDIAFNLNEMAWQKMFEKLPEKIRKRISELDESDVIKTALKKAIADNSNLEVSVGFAMFDGEDEDKVAICGKEYNEEMILILNSFMKNVALLINGI